MPSTSPVFAEFDLNAYAMLTSICTTILAFGF
jgi:hypothetical protein